NGILVKIFADLNVDADLQDMSLDSTSVKVHQHGCGAKKGRVVASGRKPSSDTATHLQLYRTFQDIGAVAHTHSTWATVMAQIGRSVPPLGTTHADHFSEAIPCTRDMSEAEITGDYEANTALVIAEAFSGSEVNNIPAVLVKNHGPFTWGATAAEAV
ncbi:MAG: class II aldolase/adducin family protein, partial [Defluviitaleaceae bacterium]|nr:class II aldolase/adducin family protein [Defluviitaleaceae bacterium]